MPDLKLPLSCEQFEQNVSDYIDGALTAADRAVMDAHRSQCSRCAALLSDVREIVASAAVLPPLSPSRDLWAGIADRLDTPVVSIGTATATPTTRGRTVSFRVFAAAAALLVSVSSGITYLVARGGDAAGASAPVVAVQSAQQQTVEANVASGTSTSTNVADRTIVPNVESAASAPVGNTTSGAGGQRSITRNASRFENSAEVAYEREITAMRRIVDQRLGDLDSVTVVEIERNLRIIDKAISDSRRALENDPRSRFLSRQLDRALESKLDVMRRIALL